MLLPLAVCLTRRCRRIALQPAWTLFAGATVTVNGTIAPRLLTLHEGCKLRSPATDVVASVLPGNATFVYYDGPCLCVSHACVALPCVLTNLSAGPCSAGKDAIRFERVKVLLPDNVAVTPVSAANSSTQVSVLLADQTTLEWKNQVFGNPMRFYVSCKCSSVCASHLFCRVEWSALPLPQCTLGLLFRL